MEWKRFSDELPPVHDACSWKCELLVCSDRDAPPGAEFGFHSFGMRFAYRVGSEIYDGSDERVIDLLGDLRGYWWCLVVHPTE
jgi:hypothetical protein